MNGSETGLPVEQFIQALTMQLDRAQSAMAMKARNLDLPLTFAVKDIALDMRAHLEMINGEIRVIPAGARDRDASLIRMAFTTITKPMIEENTLDVAMEPDDVPLREALGHEFTEEEQNRLEWAGLRTVSQLRQLQRKAGEDALRRVVQLPADRLRAALNRASQPYVRRVIHDRIHPGKEPEGVPGEVKKPDWNAIRERHADVTPLPRRDPDAPIIPERPPEPEGRAGASPGDARRNLLRIRGRNLLRNELPTIRIGREPVEVVRASNEELLVDIGAHPLAGTLSVETAPGYATEYSLSSGSLDEMNVVDFAEGGA